MSDMKGDSESLVKTGAQGIITSVQTRGIYHGLPVYPSSTAGLRALVVGANGLSGQAMVAALAENPERWETVYAMSRKKPPTNFGPSVKHLLVDLLDGPGSIAKVLKDNDVRVDYVFFFAYAQPAPKAGQPLWSNSDEMSDINGRLLENTLEALELAETVPRRFVLQTGGKTYGMHLGPVNIPWTESDPRIHLDNNFYYRQEDALIAFAAKHQTFYNVVIPSWILGAVKDAAMNILYPLSVYAAVQRHLGQRLDFPGDIIAWDKEQLQSTATMNSYFSEWLVLSDWTHNESFNIVDDHRFNWGRFWPELASWYGLEWQPPSIDATYTEFTVPMNPRGYGPNGKIRSTFSLIEWANRPETQKAWAEIAAANKITHNPFDDLERVWTPTDFALVGSWPNSVSMDKARTMGWHGYVNTHESIRQIFEQMAELQITPKAATL